MTEYEPPTRNLWLLQEYAKSLGYIEGVTPSNIFSIYKRAQRDLSQLCGLINHTDQKTIRHYFYDSLSFEIKVESEGVFRAVNLSATQNSVLWTLWNSFGDPVSSEEILRSGWPYGYVVKENVKVHICRLRHKIRVLGDFGDDTLEIGTIKNYGYLLNTRGKLQNQTS